MAYPLIDPDFTHWQGDLDTKLIDRLGLTTRELGVEARSLMEHFYSGTSIFGMLDLIVRQHALKPAK
ncbi:MAG: hypothetical protein HZC25_09095 [Rhodospirillales bacterium]|nr:hypothetical protein [Rhodospirillales bacterium]